MRNEPNFGRGVRVWILLPMRGLRAGSRSIGGLRIGDGFGLFALFRLETVEVVEGGAVGSLGKFGAALNAREGVAV